MAVDDRYAFVANLATSHGERLRRYLAARLRRSRHDVPDLVQEVYLRLLRISRPESIRNPEAYLFTIANHVLHQYVLREGMTEAVPADPADPLVLPTAATEPASEIERQQLLQELDRALGELSFKTQAALILYRRDTYSLEAIAAQLGVSVTMVKRYLAKAILHCRQSMSKR